MASPNTCYNATSIEKDKLAKDISTKDNNSLTLSLAISRAQISTLTQTLTSAQVFALTLSQPSMYIDVNIQKAIRLALKLFVKGQKHCQL